MNAGLKVIQLTAENVKRLKAIDITPDDTLQIIGGRNAQGKSSVGDAIWLALGGGAASKNTSKPVRDGEESASVRLDLGDYVVTRTWKGEKSTLTLTSPDGAKYSSPQAILDGLLGKRTIDPLEFTRLSARDQKDALLGLVDLDVDLDRIDADRKRIFDERTEIGRQGKALGEVGEIDADLPKVEQSASEIIAQIREAEDHNRNVAAWKRQREESALEAEGVANQIASLQAKLERLNANETDAKEWLKKNSERDTAPLEASLARVEETNTKIRANNQRRGLLAQKAELLDAYNAHTKKINDLDAKKAEALAAAKFPVEGLGFDEFGVTFQGVPFSQASSAEQIRVSLAIAAALNPKLRVAWIKDGSLLDADNLDLLQRLALEAGLQVWVERVGDHDKGAVIIENGEVAS